MDAVISVILALKSKGVFMARAVLNIINFPCSLLSFSFL